MPERKKKHTAFAVRMWMENIPRGLLFFFLFFRTQTNSWVLVVGETTTDSWRCVLMITHQKFNMKRENGVKHVSYLIIITLQAHEQTFFPSHDTLPTAMPKLERFTVGKRDGTREKRFRSTIFTLKMLSRCERDFFSYPAFDVVIAPPYLGVSWIGSAKWELPFDLLSGKCFLTGSSTLSLHPWSRTGKSVGNGVNMRH